MSHKEKIPYRHSMCDISVRPLPHKKDTYFIELNSANFKLQFETCDFSFLLSDVFKISRAINLAFPF